MPAKVTWAIVISASVESRDRIRGMTKNALTTDPTPMLAKTSPSEDPSSRSSFRSKTGVSAGMTTTKELKTAFRIRMFRTSRSCAT